MQDIRDLARTKVEALLKFVSKLFSGVVPAEEPADALAHGVVQAGRVVPGPSVVSAGEHVALREIRDVLAAHLLEGGSAFVAADDGVE